MGQSRRHKKTNPSMEDSPQSTMKAARNLIAYNRLIRSRNADASSDDENTNPTGKTDDENTNPAGKGGDVAAVNDSDKGGEVVAHIVLGDHDNDSDPTAAGSRRR